MEDMNLLGAEENVGQDQQMWKAVIAIQLHLRRKNRDIKTISMMMIYTLDQCRSRFPPLLEHINWVILLPDVNLMFISSFIQVFLTDSSNSTSIPTCFINQLHLTPYLISLTAHKVMCLSILLILTKSFKVISQVLLDTISSSLTAH